MKRILTLACLLSILAALEVSAEPPATPRPDRSLSPPAGGRALELVDDPLYRGDLFYYRGDFYRAITQYELFLMGNPPQDEADAVRLKMAWLYAEGDKLPAAASMLTQVIASRPRHDRLSVWSRLYFGDVALRAGKVRAAVRAYEALVEECVELAGLARDAGDEARGIGKGECLYIESYARLGLARRHAMVHDFDRAAAALRAMPERSPLRPRALRVADHVASLELPRKRPALAGALSIIPGLGHFYIEEYGAGVLAMVWNGAFIFALVDSIRAQKYGQATLIGVVEFVWYSGTIFGAVSGAHRFNRDARRIVEEGMTKDLDKIADPQPWPVRFPIEQPRLNLQWEWQF